MPTKKIVIILNEKNIESDKEHKGCYIAKDTYMDEIMPENTDYAAYPINGEMKAYYKIIGHRLQGKGKYTLYFGQRKKLNHPINGHSPHNRVYIYEYNFLQARIMKDIMKNLLQLNTLSRKNRIK